MSKNCNQCHEPVVWEETISEAGHILSQADSYGVESLTEDQQHVYEGNMCAWCYNGVGKEDRT